MHHSTTPFANFASFRTLIAVSLLSVLVSGCMDEDDPAPRAATSDAIETPSTASAELVSFNADGKATHQVVKFQEILDETDKLVVVDFWASWCGPCRMLAPELEKAVIASGDDIVLLKVDVDAEQDLAQRLGVRPIPDVRFFRNGKPAGGFVGFREADQIQKDLQQ